MNCSTTQEATLLNNEGIRLINGGNYVDAMKSISRGLGIVKRSIVLLENSTLDSDSMDTEEDQCLIGQFFEITPRCQSSALKKLTHAAKVEKPFIFSSPIYIPAASDETVGQTHRYLVTVSFIMLYNLALTHHLSAVDGSLCMKTLRKALSLYELAYAIQSTEELELSVLQTMAIVNNIGQIHIALGQEKEAKSCFEHLLSTIMFVSDCGGIDSMENLDGFMCNVMSLIFKGSSAAPAA